MCCAIKFRFQIRLIKSLWYHSTSDSLRYVSSWIKVPFLSTPKLSSQAIALPTSLVLGMQQMEGAFSILCLNVNLKTVILRQLSCFYNLSFHAGWRKTVLSCICLSDSLFSRAVQKTPPVCWRTSWGVEKWLGQKVSFTCHIKLHNLWERWITGTVKQVCHEMKWKHYVFIMNYLGGLSSISRTWELDFVSFACEEVTYSRQLFNLFIISGPIYLTLRSFPCTLRFSLSVYGPTSIELLKRYKLWVSTLGLSSCLFCKKAKWKANGYNIKSLFEGTF